MKSLGLSPAQILQIFSGPCKPSAFYSNPISGPIDRLERFLLFLEVLFPLHPLNTYL